MSAPFYNTGRIEYEPYNQTQRDMENQRYLESMMGFPYIHSANNRHDFVTFATQMPGVAAQGTVHGHGLSGQTVETENEMLFRKQRETPSERLLLIHRPFITVPYMGRGVVDPSLELQLKMGEKFFERKSTSSMCEHSQFDYHLPPDYSTSVSKDLQEQFSVEDKMSSFGPRAGATTRF